MDERDASVECGVATSSEVHLRGHIAATRTSRRGLCTPSGVVLSRPHTREGDAGEAWGAHGGFVRPFCGRGCHIIQTTRSEPDGQLCMCGWPLQKRTRFVEPDYAWAAPTCDPLARSPELIEQILESYLPENWALVVQGLSLIVPELQGLAGTLWIVVLEANPDRESYVKRWASGEMDNTRAVHQTQASIDEEAEEGEPDESGENLGERGSFRGR